MPKQLLFRPSAALLALLVLTAAMMLVGGNTAHAAVTSVPQKAVVCTSSLSYGENAECSISTSGERDRFTFTGVPGERIYARVAKKGSNRIT